MVCFSDTWSNIPNPCQNNPKKAIYLPHPTDGTKFIQCDLFGRMYIIQCPTGESYDRTTASCTRGTVVPTVIQPAVTTPTTTTTQQSIVNPLNPCSNANVAMGLIYFAYPNDNTKFIECDLLGKAMVLQCQAGLVWNQQRLSCVYDIVPGGVQTTLPPVTTGTATGTNTGTVNPATLCKVNANSLDELFHPHPDPHKFYQCDLWGDVFVNNCPTNLTWNDVAKTCSSAYLQIGPNGNVIG